MHPLLLISNQFFVDILLQLALALPVEQPGDAVTEQRPHDMGQVVDRRGPGGEQVENIPADIPQRQHPDRQCAMPEVEEDTEQAADLATRDGVGHKADHPGDDARQAQGQFLWR